MEASPFECNMLAIESSKRSAHIAMIHAVFGAVEKINEEENGYSFAFEKDAITLVEIAGPPQIRPDGFR